MTDHIKFGVGKVPTLAAIIRAQQDARRLSAIRRNNTKKLIPEETIRLVRGMRKRGDRWEDITTWTGLNRHHLRNILKSGKTEYMLPPTPLELLPPPGPYQVVSRALFEQLKAGAALPIDLIAELLSRLESIENKLAARTETARHDEAGERERLDRAVPPVHNGGSCSAVPD